MSTINQWGNTAGDNDVASPDGAQNNWTGEEINDWGRETMAQVKVWYNAPEWIDPFYALVPTGNTITRLSATSFKIVGKDGTAYLPIGRRIRIIGSSTEDMFVESRVFVTDTTVTVSGGEVPTVPTQVLVHIGETLGAIAFGGYGTEAQRDAKFHTPRDGVTWLNTSLGDGVMQIAIGGAWYSMAYQTEDGFESLEGWVISNTTSGTADSSGFALQHADKNVGIWRWSDPDLYLDIYDDADGTTLLCSYRFNDDGTIDVDDQQGGGYENLSMFERSVYVEITSNQNIVSSGWQLVTELTGIDPPSGRDAPDGVATYRIEAQIWVSNGDLDYVAILMGTNEDLTDQCQAIQEKDPIAAAGDPGGGTTNRIYASVIAGIGVGDKITIAVKGGFPVSCNVIVPSRVLITRID